MHEYAGASFQTPFLRALTNLPSGSTTTSSTLLTSHFWQLPLVMRISTSKRNVRGLKLDPIYLTSAQDCMAFERHLVCLWLLVPAMSTPESTDKDSKRHRRSHRKSRHGCVECKQRKIKCDETWPICLNCVKRDVLCSSPSRPVNRPDTAVNANANRSENLSHTPRSYRRGLRFVPSAYNSDCRAPDAGRRSGDLTASGDRPVTSRRVISNLQLLCGQLKLPESSSHPLSPDQSSSGLSYFDLELWHHYVLLTSGAVAEWSNGPGNHFWRVKVPEMGFQHPHILHPLLGLGALHKARVSPARRSSLLAQADSHHVIGMRGATEMLRTINLVDFRQHSHRLFSSACLVLGWDRDRAST